MDVGLLWFDSDRRRSAQDKLDQAAERFLARFGYPPTLCQVHPDEVFSHPAIKVLPSPHVLRGHFWVGCDEQRPVRRRRRAPIPA